LGATAENLRPSQQVRELATVDPGATTDELLHRLLCNLAKILGARRAYVTEIIDPTRSRTIASWEDNGRGPVREYRIRGTPCEAVIRDGVHIVDCELASRYAMEKASLGYGCDSFVGSPIVDHDGKRIGQVCVFGTRPLADPEMAAALVSMAAVRVSAELEHRKQEAALARSQAYSSAIVETAAEGIITLDSRGRIESANKAAEKMFGYEAGELRGRNVQSLVPEPYRSEHAKYLEHYALTGEASIVGQSRELSAQRKDGSVFPIYLAASEIRVNGEKHFAGIVRDISDQKAAEDTLRAIERRFRAVFEQQYQLATILHPDGTILEANEKSLEIAGSARNEVIGCKFWDAPWWRHSQELQLRMRDAITRAGNGGAERFEATCTCGRGQLATLDFSIRPIMGKPGRVVFLVTESRDITAQKRAEEEARQHRERIAHVSRLSTLGEMAAGIAHEINQPLTAISLFAQAGRRLIDTGNLEKMGEVCTKLNEHALRAADVVERMQTMARQGENTREIIDPDELIGSAVRLAESEARIHDIQIEFDRGRGLPPVSVDAVQIQQVALNLLRNAMEATIAKGDASLRSVAIRTRKQGEDAVEVVVSDRGCGIPEDRVDRLFTPFSTTKKTGMGMGLSISQAIVRAHGGSIDFYNNDAGGATFSFTLPAANEENCDGY
jgi:two-component system, LuxR family, sensor kinase FixL